MNGKFLPSPLQIVHVRTRKMPTNRYWRYIHCTVMYSKWCCAKYQLIVTSFRSVDRLFIVVFDNVRSRLTKTKMLALFFPFIHKTHSTNLHNFTWNYSYAHTLVMQIAWIGTHQKAIKSSFVADIFFSGRFGVNMHKSFHFFFHYFPSRFCVILWMKFVTSLDGQLKEFV